MNSQLDNAAIRCKARLFLLAAMLAGAIPAWADTRSGLADFRAGQFSEAVEAWRNAADGGDPVAALYLGVLYDTGFGVAQDPAQALAWYQRGGERGNPTAMLNTAIMIDAGRGTAADPGAAVGWYQKAADARSGRAAYNLGLLYENGIGVRADRAKAMRFFRQAVTDGVAEGRAHLARMGERHAGVLGRTKPDPAMTDFQQAQQALLTRGPEADTRAATLFRKAADAGNPLAAYNLGYCYEHGIGVSVNIDQALMWYRRSASGTTDPVLRSIDKSAENNLMVGVNQVQR